jgi:hypothetical protein
MAEDAAAKKKKKYPWGAIFWGAIGVAAGVRTLYRPYRSVMRDGFASQCASTSACNTQMTIDSFSGDSEIYSPVGGTVVGLTDTSIYIALASEPTLLEYSGDAGHILPQVQMGEQVGAGQQIGLAARIRFGVYDIERNAGGHAKVGRAYEPASWLAVHGCTVSHKKHKVTGEVWCAGGRKLVVPQEVAKCGMRLPAPNSFALLPISATME